MRLQPHKTTGYLSPTRHSVCVRNDTELRPLRLLYERRPRYLHSTVTPPLYTSATRPEPATAAPFDSTQEKQLFLRSCDSCTIGPHVVTIRYNRIIRISRNGAPLPDHCPILGSPPRVPNGTTGPYHFSLRVRTRRLHTPQRRPAKLLTLLTSS